MTEIYEELSGKSYSSSEHSYFYEKIIQFIEILSKYVHLESIWDIRGSMAIALQKIEWEDGEGKLPQNGNYPAYKYILQLIHELIHNSSSDIAYTYHRKVHSFEKFPIVNKDAHVVLQCEFATGIVLNLNSHRYTSQSYEKVWFVFDSLTEAEIFAQNKVKLNPDVEIHIFDANQSFIRTYRNYED